jgi:hypothetical protein
MKPPPRIHPASRRTESSVLELFPSMSVKKSDNEARFTNRGTKSVTFQGKLDLPIHRWYRLTPSFSPQLAHDIADHFELSAGDLVLDPFSGVGTVPLCMKYRGIPACSVEINPYLHFVSTVKTRTYRDIDAIGSSFTEFMAAARASLARVPFATRPGDYLEQNAASVPRINFPERWWSRGNLAQLVCLRQVMASFAAEPHHLDLLKMAMLSILIPVSNARHHHVSLTFAREPLPTVDVAAILGEQLRCMLADLRAVSGRPAVEVTIHRDNSKELNCLSRNGPDVSAVITSPPYPNRFSYARETRPHLFFFDFIEHAAAVGQLETDAIGGTWGRATSVLAHGIEPASALVESLLAPFVEGVDPRGDLMASYVVKYFNDIFEHARRIAEVCTTRARLAYVIGNSKFYGHSLNSDELLAAVFGNFGFSLDRIERMRRRQSKTGLYEAVVFMRRR